MDNYAHQSNVPEKGHPFNVIECNIFCAACKKKNNYRPNEYIYKYIDMYT